MLVYLLERGNTTVYEWKYDKKPVMTATNTLKEESDVVTDDAEISWDCGAVDEDFSVIDFEIEVEGETGETPANEMLSLLESKETREMLLDDLHEMTAFFTSCVDEAKLRSASVLDSIEVRACVRVRESVSLSML